MPVPFLSALMPLMQKRSWVKHGIKTGTVLSNGPQRKLKYPRKIKLEIKKLCL